MNFIWAEAITYWHVLVWSVHSCCYSDVNVRQTNTCQWSERRLCSAKNTHQRINGLKVLELPKTYLENHKMIGKCLLNVRFYRQKDLNKLYIFFCNIALTLVINSYTWNKLSHPYLARITALASIIYSSIYNVLIATNWMIGEKQLTIVYFQIWNHLNCIWTGSA